MQVILTDSHLNPCDQVGLIAVVALDKSLTSLLLPEQRCLDD